MTDKEFLEYIEKQIPELLEAGCYESVLHNVRLLQIAIEGTREGDRP